MEKLMQEYLSIKTQIEALKIRQDDIAAELTAKAEYKDGSKTAHLYAGDLHFTVAKRENVTWDQALLDSARQQVGNEAFFKIFKPEFKPVSKAVLDNALESDHDLLKPVLAAMTIKPGKAQITAEVK